MILTGKQKTEHESNEDLTRIELAAKIPIKHEVEELPLKEANLALLELKEQKIRGARVLSIYS